MKVILPYADTAEAISSSRAVLIAVAILTVFMSMITFYLIVRYVIVKPLSHLRDVSDDVSRGKLEVRAEIQTNDEFEDLAHSFNRMLRHLTDTQAELRRVNKDLDGKVDELAQLNMRLYEMNRLKDDFLANMSHELRTPLNSIIGFSEVLQGIESLNDKQKRYASNIQKSGRLLLEMINDILDLAKLEAGKMEVRPSEFRIDTVVQAQCDMVRSLAEDKNIDLVVDVDRNLPAVYQDQAKFQQILTNLLSNAIKFTPEGGRIDVFAGHDSDGKLLLTVADTGVGIAEEDRDIIFEKFRQSGSILGEDGLTREYAGTGLGLSILKELCKLLQGEISFQSELGRGSTFRVVLPWVAADRSPRESKMNVQLHDLGAPAADEFKEARGGRHRHRAAAKESPLSFPPPPAPTCQDSMPMPQDGHEIHVHLFTDGACSGNPGPGGWAFILRHLPTGKEKRIVRRRTRDDQQPHGAAGRHPRTRGTQATLSRRALHRQRLRRQRARGVAAEVEAERTGGDARGIAGCRSRTKSSGGASTNWRAATTSSTHASPVTAVIRRMNAVTSWPWPLANACA